MSNASIGQGVAMRASSRVLEMFNPALARYERLGFRKVREHGVYHFMEWSPESSA